MYEKNLKNFIFDLDNTLFDTEHYRTTGEFRLLEGAIELLELLESKEYNIYLVTAYNNLGPDLQRKT